METTSIEPQERGLAAITHLSGLSGYLIPLGGLLVPIVIWIVKSESRIVSTIAKQALLLNIIVYVLLVATIPLWFTIVLIPLALLAALALGLCAIVLPIVGALRASDGRYYRYPLIGLTP